jgi:hypothetical protein
MSKGSTLIHKCLPTYIEFYLCICKFLFVAQIKVPLGGRPTDRPTTDQPARKRTALAEKKIPRYHTIFFLAAGFKLALLVKV